MIPNRLISTGSPHQIENLSIKSSWDSMRSNLTGWEITIFSDNQCRSFIRDHFGDDVFNAYEKINPHYGAAKADFFRYCAIYQLGGIYIDIKSSLKCDPKKFILPTDQLLLSHWDNQPGQPHEGWGIHESLRNQANGEYINWLIAAKSKHPYLQEVIHFVTAQINQESINVNGRKGKQGVLEITGPIPFTLALNQCIQSSKVKMHRLFHFWEEPIEYSIFEIDTDSRPERENDLIKSEQQYNQNHYSGIKERVIPYSPIMNTPKTTQPLFKLNLGCGNKKIKGFINIDQSEQCEPDLLLNLENTPYPFKTSSVDYIRMDSVLEHLPMPPDDFFRILRELHRIAANGAILDIFCPHPFHRWQIVDFTHQRSISIEGLQMLDKEFCKELIRKGDAKTPLAIIYDVDFVIESYQDYIDPECKLHITNVLGTFDPSKIKSYCFLFNNIIGGQRIKLKVRKQS